MMLQLPCGSLILAFAAACVQSAAPPPAPALELVASYSAVDDTFFVVVSNIGPGDVALADVFGFSDVFLNIEIVRSDGTVVTVARPELFREPRRRCMRAGDSLRFVIPRTAWKPVQSRTDASCHEPACYGYTLSPGAYRLRAIYREAGVVESRQCPRVSADVTSPWVDFEI
jgi:hypothetical protein